MYEKSISIKVARWKIVRIFFSQKQKNIGLVFLQLSSIISLYSYVSFAKKLLVIKSKKYPFTFYISCKIDETFFFLDISTKMSLWKKIRICSSRGKMCHFSNKFASFTFIIVRDSWRSFHSMHHEKLTRF